MEIPNHRDIVRRGYDRLSYDYRPDDAPDDHEEYADWARELAARLPADARILDIGCGCGIPITRLLARDFDVTGVDFSPVQIERATALVPSARFLCSDVLELELPDAAYDAIVSFYAIIHMPIEEHPRLFGNIARWLKPGGVFLATLGHQAWTGTEDHYLDVDDGLMAWSHADEATNVRWIEEAGLRVEWTRFVPEGDSGHSLICASRPARTE